MLHPQIGQMSGKQRMLAAALLLALMWASQGTSTAADTAQRVPSLRATERTEDDDRPLIHAELKHANVTACGTYLGVDDVLRKFIRCLPAVSTISEDPSDACCSQVRSTGLTCLCSIFTNYRSKAPKGIVDSHKIVNLPSKCNVPVPEGSTCDGVPLPTGENAALNSADTSDTTTLPLG